MTTNETKALEMYNNQMTPIYGISYASDALKSAEDYAAGSIHFTTADVIQAINVLIDAALERCGHPYFKGSAIRLAMWCQESPTFQHKCESFLAFF